ncbi:DUF4199 domain-containing protein [Hyphomonas sp.]|jgi:hypothetical protein|uniref:DUF4199 domain-containing protein n=1 Tax=Hyphomonas sp. TaxID=87 RepID=UPI0037C02B0E
MEFLILQRILNNGVIAGLIVGIPVILLALALGEAYPSGAPGMAIGYTTMLAALSIIFHAIKCPRDVVNGGVIKFLPAFLMGLGISAVAGVLYVPAREATLAISSMDFGGMKPDIRSRRPGPAAPARLRSPQSRPGCRTLRRCTPTRSSACRSASRRSCRLESPCR